MRSGLDYDFSKYTCGINVDDFHTWDTLWYPTFGAVETSAFTTTVTSATLSVTSGTNFKYWPWPLINEAYSLNLRTSSFL